MPADPRIDLSAPPEDQREAVAALLRERDGLESGTAALEADAAALKAEAAALQARNTDLTAETTDLKEIVKRLEHLVAELNHVVHGKKSEKLAEDDRQLAFEGEPCRAVAGATPSDIGERDGGVRARGAAR